MEGKGSEGRPASSKSTTSVDSVSVAKRESRAEESYDGPRERESVPFWKLVMAVIPWVGIQAIWQTQFGLITPLMESRGLSTFWSSNIWIFGPIAGFFTAPIVGAWSDASGMKLGRRRPFMIGGLVCMAIASMLFAGAPEIFAENIVLGCSFFFSIILDVFINMIQTPTRALVSDIAATSQQSTGQLLAVFCQGAGGLLGYGLMNGMYSNEKDAAGLFATVVAINIFFVGACCIFIKEEVNKHPTATSALEPFSIVIRAIVKIDLRLLIVAACQFFSWAALFAWWPTASTWFGINVMSGCSTEGPDCSPEANALYNDGLSHYSRSGIYANLLQIVYGFFLASLVTFGYLKRTRFVYAGSLAVGAVMLILSKFGPQTLGMAYAVAILAAVPISAINAFPFAIVGKYHAESSAHLDVGVQMGILNLFICTPQLIITFVVAGMRSGLGESGLAWALVIGGCCFGVAAIIALFVREIVDKPQSANDV